MAAEIRMTPTKLPNAVLFYDGVEYPLHRISLFNKDACLERWIKSRREWKWQNHFPGPNGYPRWKVKGQWITASLAVQQSFARVNGNDATVGLLACHLPGNLPSEIGLSACILGSAAENRSHRRLVGTHSTGRDTFRGKLRGKETEIVRLYDADPKKNNKSALARKYGVRPGSIRNLLKRRGRK